MKPINYFLMVFWFLYSLGMFITGFIYYINGNICLTILFILFACAGVFWFAYTRNTLKNL